MKIKRIKGFFLLLFAVLISWMAGAAPASSYYLAPFTHAHNSLAAGVAGSFALDSSEKVTEEELVRAWFKESATAFIRAHARDDFGDVNSDEIADIQISEPVRALEFSDVNAKELSARASSMWVASLSLKGENLGVLSVTLTSGQIGVPVVTRSSESARALREGVSGASVVYDPVTKGWYLFDSDGVRALDSVAHNALAGLVTAEQFQMIRKERQSSAAKGEISSQEGETEEESGDAVRGVAISAVIFLLIVLGVMIWNRGADHYEDLNPENKGAEKETEEKEKVEGGQAHDTNWDENEEVAGAEEHEKVSRATAEIPRISERTIRSHTGEIVRVIEIAEKEELQGEKQ